MNAKYYNAIACACNKAADNINKMIWQGSDANIEFEYYLDMISKKHKADDIMRQTIGDLMRKACMQFYNINIER